MMRKTGPIIVIEDDTEDQELLEETFKVLNYPNPVIFFSDGFDALHYIATTDVIPFLIISDINMPRINGFQLKNMIQKSEPLKLKHVPYLFLTTGSENKFVEAAYAMSAHGFFIKPNSMKELKRMISTIVEYWQECRLPFEYTAKDTK